MQKTQQQGIITANKTLTINCVYLHEWLPCDFCRARNITFPCIKLLGSKITGRASLCLPVPTAIDAVINSEDVLLLQYAYSEKFKSRLFSAMIKQLGVEYEQAMPCPSLVMQFKCPRGLAWIEARSARTSLTEYIEGRSYLRSAILLSCSLAYVGDG